MAGFIINIEKKTRQNEYFREVLFTAPHSQLVIMSLKPNENIGMEVHPQVDQFIRIEEGQGKAILNGEESILEEGSAIVIPAGTEHDIINTSPNQSLKLYTLYSPPNHPEGTLHQTKAEAEAAEEH